MVNSPDSGQDIGSESMVNSQNGWPASSNRAAIGTDPNFNVAGVTFPGGVKSGAVTVVLGYVAQQFHSRVESLVKGWCWGWSYRDIRGSNTTSNHGSASAIDCNAPNHPLGVRGTFSAAQVRTIHQILNEVDNVVRWGGDYSGRVDEMHFEINASAAAVQRVANRISGGNITTPTIPSGTKRKAVEMIERVVVPGANYFRIACPVGGASMIASRGWVSITTAGGFTGRVCFQKAADTDDAPPGTGPIWNPVAKNAQRPWNELPDGTEYIEAWIDSEGEGSLLIEFMPR